MKTCTRCKIEKPISEFWRTGRHQRHGSHCKECRRESVRAYKEKTPNYDRDRYWRDVQGTRERHLKRKYGVDLVGYEAMFKAQRGACAICGKSQSRALNIDHDHTTGEVRGLLCSSCNRALGWFGDSLDLLRSAVGYLESSRKLSKPLRGKSGGSK